MTKYGIGLSMAMTAMAVAGVTGCATKNYVRTQTAPIIEHTDQLTAKTADNTRAIRDTDDRAQALAVLVALVHVAVTSIEKLLEPRAVSVGDDSLLRARRCCRSAAARLDSVCRR